jgi:hypothetical protein
MRMILSLVTALMMSSAAEARCMARLSEPQVYIKDDCEDCEQLIFSLRAMKLKPNICSITTDPDCREVYETWKEGDEMPLTFVCNTPIFGNRPKKVMETIEHEKTEIHPDEYDYGDWDE